MLLYFVFFMVIANIGYTQKSTPCPEVFSYEPRGTETDRWYGIILLNTDEELKGIWIHVVLDKPAELLGNWFGEASSIDNVEFTIKNLSYTLQPGPSLSLRFFIKYKPTQSVPSLTAIRLNGKLICSEDSIRPSNSNALHISQSSSGSGSSSSRNPGNRVPSGSSGNNYGNTNNNPSSNQHRPGSTSSSSGRPSSGSSSSTTLNNREPVYVPTNSNSGSSSSTNNRNPVYNNNNSGSSSTGSSTRSPVYNQGSSSGSSSNNRNPTYNPSSSSGNSDYGSNSNINREPAYNSGNSNSGGSSSNNRNPSGHGINGNNNNNIYSNEDYGSNNNNGRDPDYNSNNNNNYNRPNSGSSNNDYNNNDNNDNRGSSNSGGITFIDDTTAEPDFFPGDFIAGRPGRPSISRPTSPTRNPIDTNFRTPGCGTVAMQPVLLISHGQGTSPGQWPWHAALYHSQGVQLTYICGGTLVSDKHIITAAHCVTKPRRNTPINPENVIVYLGKYNLKKFGTETQDREISKIYVHPNYNSTSYFNDIAVLKMNDPAEISNYVRPCCLWDGSTELSSIIDELGTVVGWGFDENKQLSNELMKAEMPVVDTAKCIYSNRDFFSQFTNEQTYCAGFRNGTSVCNGDSGGGMVFPKRGTSGSGTIWQLRGIVSVGVALQGEGVCDPSHYIVFTDVAKHLNWVKNIMDQNSNNSSNNNNRNNNNRNNNNNNSNNRQQSQTRTRYL